MNLETGKYDEIASWKMPPNPKSQYIKPNLLYQPKPQNNLMNYSNSALSLTNKTGGILTTLKSPSNKKISFHRKQQSMAISMDKYNEGVNLSKFHVTRPNKTKFKNLNTLDKQLVKLYSFTKDLKGRENMNSVEKGNQYVYIYIYIYIDTSKAYLANIAALTTNILHKNNLCTNPITTTATVKKSKKHRRIMSNEEYLSSTSNFIQTPPNNSHINKRSVNVNISSILPNRRQEEHINKQRISNKQSDKSNLESVDMNINSGLFYESTHQPMNYTSIMNINLNKSGELEHLHNINNIKLQSTKKGESNYNYKYNYNPKPPTRKNQIPIRKSFKKCKFADNPISIKRCVLSPKSSGPSTIRNLPANYNAPGEIKGKSKLVLNANNSYIHHLNLGCDHQDVSNSNSNCDSNCDCNNTKNQHLQCIIQQVQNKLGNIVQSGVYKPTPNINFCSDLLHIFLTYIPILHPSLYNICALIKCHLTEKGMRRGEQGNTECNRHSDHNSICTYLDRLLETKQHNIYKPIYIYDHPKTDTQCSNYFSPTPPPMESTLQVKGDSGNISMNKLDLGKIKIKHKRLSLPFVNSLNSNPGVTLYRDKDSATETNQGTRTVNSMKSTPSNYIYIYIYMCVLLVI